MVIFFPAVLKVISVRGRDYFWPKPDSCPRCNSRQLWGHGFVTSYFDGFNQPLFLKRYRCPNCGCIIRLRPNGYFKRFQAPIDTIRKSISRKSESNTWLTGISRTRQCHWLRALKRRIKAYFGEAWNKGLLKAFDYFVEHGRTPVSRSI